MHSPGFFDGMLYPLLGVKHLANHRELWPYALKAFLVSIVLFVVLAGVAAVLTLGIPARIASEGIALKAVLLGCLAIILGITGGVVIYALVGNVIAGPYLEAMTERMMADAGRIKETPRGYWSAFAHGLAEQLLRLFMFLAVQLGLLGIYCTPGAFIHPLIAGATTVFFVALEHLEYPLEAGGLRFFDRINWALKRAAPSLGFGTTLFFILPVAGFLLLPAAVCGGVLLEQELTRIETINAETQSAAITKN